MRKLLLALLLFAPLASADNYWAFDGNDQMEGTFTSSYGDPVTIGAWILITDHPAALQAVVHLSDSASSLNDSYLCRLSSNDNQFQITSTDSGATATSAAATKTIDGVWTPILCEVFDSDTDRTVFIGDQSGTNAVTRAVAGTLNDISIGETAIDTQDFVGGIAYVAIWDRQLNDTEEADFLSGDCPSTIGASDLVGYWDLQTNSSTQTNEGVDATGDLTVSTATFTSTGGPGITCTITPTFDVTPSVTNETTDTYTLTYDTALAQNFFSVAVIKDSAAPTCDEIEAQTAPGEVVYATEAATNASDTINLAIPGGDPFPLYDIHACAESSTSTDTAVTSLNDETLDEPTGRQYIVKSGGPGGGEIGLLDDASPAAVDGDYIDASETTDSFALGAGAHTLTVNADTTFEIDTGGDSSRQILTRRFYDVSVGDWSDADPVELAINDLAPVHVGIDYDFIVDVPVSLLLDTKWLDPENDDMTHAIANGPADLSVSGNETLTGTPTACGNDTDTQLTATDEYGEDTAATVTIRIGALVPEFEGDDEATYVAEVEALCALTASAGTPQYSDTVPEGEVITTDPAAGEFVENDATVTYVLSLGPSFGRHRMRLGLGLGVP